MTAALNAGHAAITTGVRMHTQLIISFDRRTIGMTDSNGWTGHPAPPHAECEQSFVRPTTESETGQGGEAKTVTPDVGTSQNSIRRTWFSAPGTRVVLALRARPSAQLRSRLICSSMVLASGTVWRNASRICWVS